MHVEAYTHYLMSIVALHSQPHSTQNVYLYNIKLSSIIFHYYDQSEDFSLYNQKLVTTLVSLALYRFVAKYTVCSLKKPGTADLN